MEYFGCVLLAIIWIIPLRCYQGLNKSSKTDNNKYCKKFKYEKELLQMGGLVLQRVAETTDQHLLKDSGSCGRGALNLWRCLIKMYRDDHAHLINEIDDCMKCLPGVSKKKIQQIQTEIESVKKICEDVGILSWEEQLKAAQSLRIRYMLPQVGIMENLKRLHIIGAALQQLPSQIGSLKNLKSLILIRNFLKQLPESFSSLVNLRNLSLAYNKFESIPQVIQHCCRLTKLNMEHNKLTKQSEPSFYYLCYVPLKILNISHNNMIFFPTQIYEIQTLKKLYMTNNAMYILYCYRLFELSNLKEIEMSYDSYWSIPEFFRNRLPGHFLKAL